MLPSVVSNALSFTFLALSFIAFVSANGRSGYNQVNETDAAGGRSGYNQVNQADNADGRSGYNQVNPAYEANGRSGYNKIKRSRRETTSSGYNQVNETDAAGGRSGYNQVNHADNADGRSGYNQVNPAYEANGRSGYNKIKRSRRETSSRAALYDTPAEWTVPGVFIMDPGLACDSDDLLASEYMGEDTANTTGTCYNGKLYYLLQAGSVAVGHFSIPPGLASVNLNELVAGSVQIYESNGNNNGGGTAAVWKTAAHDDQAIIASGHVQIPVCGLDEALGNWKNPVYRDGRYPTFPCNR